MKLALTLIAVLFWQSGNFSPYIAAPKPSPEIQDLRYERSLTLPAGASGIACAVLDAKVYAHAANWSGDDLRIFRVSGSDKQEEIPLRLSYSAALPTNAVTATVQNLSLHNGSLVFDLEMPQRAYTIVDLHLAARNFIAAADVSGSNRDGDPVKWLGTFALFDFTGEHLARSTSLALQESSFSKLHITLHLHSVEGGAFPHLSPAIVEGATVPASREAQTLYTAAASTTKFIQESTSTVGIINVPAHVPIERVNFILDPAYKLNFLRGVSVAAGRDARALIHPQEIIGGEIWRVTRKGDASGDLAIRAEKLAFDAAVASNLHEPAIVKVEVENGSEQPLPVRAVQLEMRQRTICFNAVAGSTYILRYGDDALRAAVYDTNDLVKMPVEPLIATLGPEKLNDGYVERNSAKGHDKRNSYLYWITLLAMIVAIGAIANRHTKWWGE